MHFHSVLSRGNYVVLSDGHAILLNFLRIAEQNFHLRDLCLASGCDVTYQSPNIGVGQKAILCVGVFCYSRLTFNHAESSSIWKNSSLSLSLLLTSYIERFFHFGKKDVIIWQNMPFPVLGKPLTKELMWFLLDLELWNSPGIGIFKFYLFFFWCLSNESRAEMGLWLESCRGVEFWQQQGWGPQGSPQRSTLAH